MTDLFSIVLFPFKWVIEAILVGFQHRGTLTLRSRPRQGTTVQVRLPQSGPVPG